MSTQQGNYQICRRCVMDTTDPYIKFDEKGICNHCKEYFKLAKQKVFVGNEGEKRLNKIIDDIKKSGKGHKYDSIIGLSGGVDSSYSAYLTKRFGLRPLAVVVDNGYDSRIAKMNVKNIVKKFNWDLYTYIINQEEFIDLQLAYLKASVIDIEAITDHAIAAVLYKVACENKVKYIISGNNIVTEAILPESWSWYKNDLKNLKNIHKKFGTIKLKEFPTLGIWKDIYYRVFKKIKFVTFLNYVKYIKRDAKKIIIKELNWKDYGVKHSESIFTKFYQCYILPQKFNVDKRKAHLSTLICSGQITRNEALKELMKPLYNQNALKKDKAFVLNKLGLSEVEFEKLMRLPIKAHQIYGSDKWLYVLLKRFYFLLKKFRK